MARLQVEGLVSFYMFSEKFLGLNCCFFVCFCRNFFVFNFRIGIAQI
jgi:hypothetical protein